MEKPLKKRAGQTATVGSIILAALSTYQSHLDSKDNKVLTQSYLALIQEFAKAQNNGCGREEGASGTSD